MLEIKRLFIYLFIYLFIRSFIYLQLYYDTDKLQTLLVSHFAFHIRLPMFTTQRVKTKARLR
jgi:hypothetical protein